LPPDLAAAARDTLGGALNVASQLPDGSAAATLALSAQQAMTSAVQVTCAVSAVISILTAVAVAVYFNPGRERCPEGSILERGDQQPAAAI
jgi:DHA2 family multidrug resistance protein-like MFS transporter